MIDLERLVPEIENIFTRIQKELMAGLPIMNTLLRVQALGFQHWGDRCFGVVITPWFISLLLLPGEDEDWSGLRMGSRQIHEFPSKSYDFLANEIEGIGYCQMYSLYSPVFEFESQEAAVVAANAFLGALMTEPEEVEVGVDQERIDRFLRGEDMADIAREEAAKEEQDRPTLRARVEKRMSRRELLRGEFLRDNENTNG